MEVMSISELSSRYKSDLQSVDNKFESIKYTSAIDVINDENLKLPVITTDKNDLSKLSISQLNDTLNSSNFTLVQLNKLWIIKGLIQEVKASLNPVDETNYTCDKHELQSIVNNLIKLKQKISQFDESLIIFDSLNKAYLDLISNADEQLTSNFQLFFPEDNSFINNVITNDIDMTYKEFLEICNLSEDMDSSFSIKSLHHKLQLQWDKLLDQLINHKKALKLEQQDNTFSLKALDEISGFRQYCRSITEFINFINLFNNQSFKNFYLSKISNNLTNKISENINDFINPTNDDLIKELLSIINLTKDSHWMLSIEKFLTSETDINNKLNDLYLDWVVDKYINRLRNVYNSDFDQLSNDIHDEHYSQEMQIKDKKQVQNIRNKSTSNTSEDVDGWNEWDNDGWDDEEIPGVDFQPGRQIEGTDSNWNDDDWDQDGWDEAETNLTQDQKNKEVYKVSQMPLMLKGILADYQKETRNSNIQPLISTIESFSIISYPPLNESFLLHNDLQSLNNFFMNDQLIKFLDINLKQSFQSFSNEVKLILISINLKHDDMISDTINLDNFKLDNENEIKLKLINNWFNRMNKSNLKSTNKQNYKKIIMDVISIILNWMINSILSMDEITEYQSTKFTSIINTIQHIININLVLLDESNASVAAYNKLNNVLFLINNHLKDIMELFYQGEFFDLSTNELISIIESIFIKSDLRDNYIDEILDIRNVEA